MIFVILPISFATILKFSDAISGLIFRSNFCKSFKAYIDLFIASICLFLVSNASCFGAKDFKWLTIALVSLSIPILSLTEIL